MDPKLPGTDPKLQEAYNRVMNGPSVPPPPAPMPAAPTMPQQSTAPMQPAPMPAAPAQPAAPMTASTLAFNANNPSKNQGATVKRGGSKIMSLVVALGIIVLLVVYTFVWIYVFKLQIPFLPQFSQ